jgi:two-component system sensor histidine kinase RegB
MADQLDLMLGRAARRLRLETLVKLRWLAVLGQLTAIVLVHYGLGFAVPLAPCLVVIAVSVWLNIALMARYPVSYRLPDRYAFALLAFDVLQLAALLYLTGGLENPFALLFLAPVLISATALPPRLTVALGLTVLAVSSVLAFQHWPLPWSEAEPLDLPDLYLVGIWSAILLGVAFTAIYAWRVAAEAGDLAEALAAAELVIAREQHLSQLDGLAAAAAHELGTPLATITLIAKEIANSAPPGSQLAEDVDLLRQEAQRCRAILARLTTLNEDEGVLATLGLRQLLEETAAPERHFGMAITVALDGDGAEPVMRRNPAVLYGLGNLVDNAVDFAASQVSLTGTWSASKVVVEISDDGPGFPPEVLMRFGEPYVTTRRVRPREGGRDEPDKRGGMGLGLFIAKTLLERSGAQVQVSNGSSRATGARIRLTWARQRFEADVAGRPVHLKIEKQASATTSHP